MLENNSLLKSDEEQAKPLSYRIGWIFGSVSVFLLLVCLGFLTPQGRKIRAKLYFRGTTEEQINSQVLSLVAQTPVARADTLRKLVEKSGSKLSSIDRLRVRYLLATDLLSQGQGKAALEYLTALEQDYPLLAPYIMFRQAQAYKQMEQAEKVSKIREELMATYPNSAVIPDVLALTAHNKAQFSTLLLKQFPYHPQTQALLRQKIAQKPEQWELLLSLVKHSRESDLVKFRDRLVLQYPSKLTKEDWEVLASGYWREGENRKAADAYALSPPTPQNIYRTARGFHLNGNFAAAKRAYQRLIREYHDAQETGWALVYLARLSSADEAIAYLDIAIEKFPEQVPQALLAKAKIYDKFDKPSAATEARNKALNDSQKSPASLEYRWKMAQQAARNGDLAGAWQWGEAIAKYSDNPKNIFWVGKWAQQLDKTSEAKKAFERVIATQPQSYYGWRSAVLLGWDVGDFNSLRSVNPSLSFPQEHEPLPMGSEILQELYLLGQYESAWIQFQSEIAHPQSLTVAEQFTESVLLIKLGKIRSGIQSILDLRLREYPQEIAKWRSLRQLDTYWWSLFPFPYRQEILNYADQDKINPLLVLSVMRKESTFEADIGSRVGAVGLMQVIPSTAKWVAEQAKIPDYSLPKPEDNIKIGTWYLAYNHKRYQDNSLYAIASYNAGTGNVNQWLKRYNTKDLDVFVEQIPFPETKDYVEGVFGNYWNYLRLYNPKIQQLLKNKINQ
ncbi:MAG: transglycosylase SLT domain-containing protein [Xenococcaceae cyanobacterium MO_207.B15]|nr:transglycosylase SLT domain-containing protein [Xenococcaceae cyanobacterium MO_207.B15]